MKVKAFVLIMIFNIELEGFPNIIPSIFGSAIFLSK